jgi:hypothetical protein
MGVIARAYKRIQSIDTKERGLCNDTLAEERIKLKYISNRQVVKSWICLCGTWQVLIAGLCKTIMKYLSPQVAGYLLVF